MKRRIFASRQVAFSWQLAWSEQQKEHWMTKQTWAVIGASGWVGQNIVQVARSLGHDCHLFGSHHRYALVAGEQEEIRTFTLHEVTGRSYDLIWFCAFDNMRRIEASNQAFVNSQRIVVAANQVAKLADYGRLIAFSSGAAIQAPYRETSYAKLKRRLESSLLARAVFSNRDVRIARLWSMSGMHCPRPEDFAITSMIQSATDYNHIQIKSSNYVYRRYCQIAEYIDALASTNLEARVLNSGGPVIEMGELANLIAEMLGNVEVIDLRTDKADEEHFYARDRGYEKTLTRIGVQPSSMREQLEIML